MQKLSENYGKRTILKLASNYLVIWIGKNESKILLAGSIHAHKFERQMSVINFIYA